MKAEGFDSTRRVGNAMQAARIHNMRGVDELVLLEVGGGPIDAGIVRELASDCFMPLTVGGGIIIIEQMRDLLKAGADKVAICAAAHEDPALIRKAALKFGSQSVVVVINVSGNKLRISGRTVEDSVLAWAEEAQERGAGEILLQSVERDGTMQGYDTQLIKIISETVSVPVVASGGCGNYEHMAEALRAGAHAVAAGAMFQFTDRTPAGASAYLRQQGFHTRRAEVDCGLGL